MNEQILKKVAANVIQDAKSTLIEEGHIPVIWHMIKDDLIYQVSKTICDDEDSTLALEIAGLALDWIKPECIIQVANTHMNIFTEGKSQPDLAEMLLVVKHIRSQAPTTQLCKIYRNAAEEVTGFSHFFSEQTITLNDPLFKPYELEVKSPSDKAIKIVQGMFGKTSGGMLRLVG